MSVPNEIDFAQILIGDGAPTEAFTVICDLSNVSVNQSANTTDRFRRDCALPNKPATRKVKVTGYQWDITGSGLADSAQIVTLKAAIGKAGNFQVKGYQDDGTDAGLLIGTYEGEAVMTADNMQFDRDGETSLEITLAGNGDLTWTPAP